MNLWRCYVSDIYGCGDIYLDQGALSWNEARDVLRQWIALYSDDDREQQSHDAAHLLRDLADTPPEGSFAGLLAGELHALFRDLGNLD